MYRARAFLRWEYPKGYLSCVCPQAWAKPPPGPVELAHPLSLGQQRNSWPCPRHTQTTVDLACTAHSSPRFCKAESRKKVETIVKVANSQNKGLVKKIAWECLVSNTFLTAWACWSAWIVLLSWRRGAKRTRQSLIQCRCCRRLPPRGYQAMPSCPPHGLARAASNLTVHLPQFMSNLNNYHTRVLLLSRTVTTVLRRLHSFCQSTAQSTMNSGLVNAFNLCDLLCRVLLYLQSLPIISSCQFWYNM